jgi:hypothetical protein
MSWSCFVVRCFTRENPLLSKKHQHLSRQAKRKEENRKRKGGKGINGNCPNPNGNGL